MRTTTIKVHVFGQRRPTELYVEDDGWTDDMYADALNANKIWGRDRKGVIHVIPTDHVKRLEIRHAGESG